MSDQITNDTVQVSESLRPEVYLKAFRAYMLRIDLEQELLVPETSVLLLNLRALSELALKANSLETLESLKEILSAKIKTWLDSRPRPSTTEVKIVRGRSHMHLRLITRANSDTSIALIVHNARSSSLRYTEEIGRMVVTRIAQSLIDFARADEMPRSEIILKTSAHSPGPNKPPTLYQQGVGRLEV